MADSVVAQWHGGNYQSRVFWENALNLLEPTSNVAEVTFEANGPKAFDDVVVKYDPPVARSGPDRVSAEYHQVKWHTNTGGRFGFHDFVDPAFIGASKYSLLERLREARKGTTSPSRFTLITTDRASDGDPLAELISGNDRSLLLEKLFTGTTDKSRMGEVRKLWREHLNLVTDEELRSSITGLRILEGHRSLDEMRDQINLKARTVGLLPCSNTTSDFRYDELARQLKVRHLNSLTREILEQICRDEGLFAERKQEDDPFINVAIRSFLGAAADIVGARPEDTLLLTDDFRQRYLRDDLDWQRDIRPKVETFLRSFVPKVPRLRLILDAHASIAFLAGTILNLKSGVAVELVQKGRVGSRIWVPDDGSAAKATPFTVTTSQIGTGHEIAIAVSLSQPTTSHTKAYVSTRLPNVGQIVSFTPTGGPGQQSVAGGEHACVLAEQVSNTLREIKIDHPDALVHIFAASPNSFLFSLGQQYQGITPCIVYEFDFDRQGNKTYQPSFIVD